MNLKKTLQAPMRRRQVRKYEERINSQTVAYHDWIIKKKSKKGKQTSPKKPLRKAGPFRDRRSPWNISLTAGAGNTFP